MFKPHLHHDTQDEWIETLLDRVCISDVIAKHISLEKNGDEYKGLCPFHKEKTPSFWVNNQKNVYHCFGCGVGGNVIQFYQAYHNLSFYEAATRLGYEYGLERPKQLDYHDPERVQKQQKAKTHYQLYDATKRFYQNYLSSPEAENVRQYLYKRGLNDEVIKYFQLGYAPKYYPAQKDTLITHLKHNGFTEADMQDCGVISQRQQDHKAYERFFDRIIFPIFDDKKRAIAFGGRAVGEAQPKYLNSPETDLFHKKQVLYHFDPHFSSKDYEAYPLILVEGYMDVITLYQFGFPKVVAPLGTAVTEEQLALIWSVAKKPIICMDGDQAGYQASYKIALKALTKLQIGYSLQFVILPYKQDPDSFIRTNGAKAFQEYINQAQSLYAFLWQHFMQDIKPSTPDDWGMFEANLAGLFARIPEPTLKKQYLQQLKQDLYAHKWGAKKSTPKNPFLMPQKPNNALVASYHKAMLACFLNHPQLLEDFFEDFSHISFENESYQQLQSMLLEWVHVIGESPLDKTTLYNHLQDKGLAYLYDSLLKSEVYMMAPFAAPSASFEKVAKGVKGLLPMLVGQTYIQETELLETKLFETLDPDLYEKWVALKQKQGSHNRDHD